MCVHSETLLPLAEGPQHGLKKVKEASWCGLTSPEILVLNSLEEPGAQTSSLWPQGFIPKAFFKDFSGKYSTAPPRTSFAVGCDFFAMKCE